MQDKIHDKLQELFKEGTIDSREFSEILFALYYVSGSNHGTDGHHRLNLIAKLIRLLAEKG